MKKMYRLLLVSLFIIFSLLVTPVNIAFANETNDEDNNEKFEISFDELYTMPEEEYSDFCRIHNLPYESPELTEDILRNSDEIFVLLRLDKYAKDNDLIYSTDATALDTHNLFDYSFEKMISDLQFPQKYYDIGTEEDWQLMVYTDKYDSNKSLSYYIKLAALPIRINDLENSDSQIRLTQLILSWSALNDNVYGHHISYLGAELPSSTELPSLVTTTTTVSDTTLTLTSMAVSQESSFAFESTSIDLAKTSTTTAVLKSEKNGKTEASPKTGSSDCSTLLVASIALLVVCATTCCVKVKKE